MLSVLLSLFCKCSERRFNFPQGITVNQHWYQIIWCFRSNVPLPTIRGRGVCVCNTTQMSGKEIWWLPQDFCEILGIFHVHFCSFLVHFNIHVLFDLSYSWLHRELITKSTNHAYNCTHTFCLSLCYKYVTVIKSSCSSPSPSQVYSLPTLLPYSGTSLL